MKAVVQRPFLMARNELKPHDRPNEQEDEEHPPEKCWFVKKYHSNNRCTHRANSRPYCITGSHWDCLHSFIQKIKTQGDAHKKSYRPKSVGEII